MTHNQRQTAITHRDRQQYDIERQTAERQTAVRQTAGRQTAGRQTAERQRAERQIAQSINVRISGGLYASETTPEGKST